MKKIWIGSIVAVVLLGLILFLFFDEKKQMIEVANYNQTSSLQLGRYKLSHYSAASKNNMTTSIATFTFKDSDDEKRFLRKIPKMTTYLGMYRYNPHERSSSHYFFSEGYYYRLSKNALNVYEFSAVYANFFVYNSSIMLRFHFPFYEDFDDQNIKSVTLNMTYETFIEFYERLSTDEVTIDHENKTVYSAVYEGHEQDTIVGKPIKITWVGDGVVTINYKSSDE